MDISVAQRQVELWRGYYVVTPTSISLENILPGTDFFEGPSQNTRSQIYRRLLEF